MTAISPFALLRDSQPAALAGRALAAAADLAGDARDAARGKTFSDLVDGLDANQNGHIGLDDAVGLAGRGAAKVVSALTGVEIDTTHTPADRINANQPEGRIARAALPPPPAASQLPSPPPPPPPTVEGIHQLYADLRAMRS
ncbi:MAG TPA: hypothetical protein DEO85_11280 [Maritimibacter sp.]|nr:hypothetical protein [Maritimibacter sp.]